MTTRPPGRARRRETGFARPKRVGLVTLGQAPRDDIVPGMRPFLGAETVLEAGALDDVTVAELRHLKPQGPGQALVTRLRDGSAATIDKELVLPRLQVCITRLEEAGVDLIVVLCTGTFPRLKAARTLVLDSDRLLRQTVAGVLRQGPLGVMAPLEEQVEAARARWQALGVEVAVAAGSPYGPPAGRLRAADALRDAGASLVVLDCMGYTAAMKEEVRPRVGCPVLVAHEVVARIAGALV